jgi:hypothetical protein
MFIGMGAYYMYTRQDVAFAVLENKKETSDLLNDQIDRALASNQEADVVATSSATSSAQIAEFIAREILAGNYASEEGIQVVIKRNKKVIIIEPQHPVKKGDWELTKNNVLSISVKERGTTSKLFFSVEDPEKEIVEIKPGDPIIYTRN